MNEKHVPGVWLVRYFIDHGPAKQPYPLICFGGLPQAIRACQRLNRENGEANDPTKLYFPFSDEYRRPEYVASKSVFVINGKESD